MKSAPATPAATPHVEPAPHAEPLSAAAVMALTGLCLSMLMASLDTSIAHTALPVLAQAFHASFRQAQWIVLAYLLTLTALAVVAGRLGDAIGRRRLLLAGVGVFTTASVLCAAAPSLALLVAARALQGVGAAVMTALTMALAADIVASSARGRVLGLLGTMSAIGTTLGPSLGGLLVGTLGWQAIFLVNLPLGLLNLLLIGRFVPADRPRQPPAPGSMRGLLKEPAVRACLGMMLLVSMVMMATLVVGPFYLSRALGLDVAAVGLALSAGPLVAALAGVPAGMLADRFGPRAMTHAGLAGIAAGCAVLALLDGTLAAYLAPLLLVTASYALFQAANGTALMAAAPQAQRGAAWGLLGLARNLGLVAGTSVMGSVFAAGWARGDAMAAGAAQVAAGMHATSALAAGLMLLAMALARSTPRQ